MTFNKPPEWGKQFSFHENIRISYNGYEGNIVSEIAVKMVERYENAIVDRIAMEAKMAGVAKCVVLNKAAILAALDKQMPKKPVEIAKSELYGRRAICGNTVHVGHRYCDQCGQSLEWEEIIDA